MEFMLGVFGKILASLLYDGLKKVNNLRGKPTISKNLTNIPENFLSHVIGRQEKLQAINEKLKKVTTSNGIVWSSDKKFMYYNDTPTNRIARYRYNNSTGEILFDGIAVNIPKGTGSPDGMTIDSNDNLWVAQWGGSGVYCYSPYTGELLRKVEVPALHVASCAFGGAHLDTLYITTARAGLNKQELEKYPLSGSLFKCVPGVKGVAANSFGLK